MSRECKLWVGGVLVCCLFVCFAVAAMWHEGPGSPDEVWARMWCYLAAAGAGLLLPWLISRRAVWSTRLGAGLGLVAALGMFAVACGDCGSADIEMPWGAGQAVFLWGSVAGFLAAGLLPCLRRQLRGATHAERAGLRRAGRVLLALVAGFGLFVLHTLAGLILSICRDEFHWWEYLLLVPLYIGMFIPILWGLAELLPVGRWQRACFRVFLWGLLPGLGAAAITYFLEWRRLAELELLSVRVAAALFPLLLAVLCRHYIRYRIQKED